MSGGTAAASLGDALRAAVDALRAAGVDTPRLDAELLLAEATGSSRSALIADPGRAISGAEARSFGAMVRRRVAREPVAYILARKGFRRIELQVDRRVLIPRPETELLVEVALRERPRSVLDVGTGSGAIALAVADEMPDAEVVAVDTSIAALDLARSNAVTLGMAGRVRFELGYWPVDGVTEGSDAGSGFDLVLANLPYVPAGERRSLAPEIGRYEPETALFAGEDGLDAIRGLLARLEPRGELVADPDLGAHVGADPEQRLGAIPEATAAGSRGRCGVIALEIGIGQAEAVSELVIAAGFAEVEAIADLAGIPRVIVGRSRREGGSS